MDFGEETLILEFEQEVSLKTEAADVPSYGPHPPRSALEKPLFFSFRNGVRFGSQLI